MKIVIWDGEMIAKWTIAQIPFNFRAYSHRMQSNVHPLQKMPRFVWQLQLKFWSSELNINKPHKTDIKCGARLIKNNLRSPNAIYWDNKTIVW